MRCTESYRLRFELIGQSDQYSFTALTLSATVDGATVADVFVRIPEKPQDDECSSSRSPARAHLPFCQLFLQS